MKSPEERPGAPETTPRRMRQQRQKTLSRGAIEFSPYQKRLRALFESLLGRKLAPRDGIAETERWSSMPKRLREYYQLAGRLDSINCSFDRLYRPNKLDDVDGFRVFMEENQTVVLWAFKIEDADQEDPTIYVER
jgi:hypothetical protein